VKNRGGKREKPKQMNDDEQREKESDEYSTDAWNTQISQPNSLKLLAPELFFCILAHSVYKT